MKEKILIFLRLFFTFIIISFLSGIQHLNCQQTKDEIKFQVDIEPGGRQLPYSPADGSTAKVNPPPFIWVPVKGHVNYILQISRDKNFSTDVIIRKGIDISTYALEQSLEPGEWFWRYGVEDSEVIYSKARRFTVPEDAKIWYFPGIEQVIDNIPRSRPRLFILKDEVGSYRYRAKYGDLKEFCSNLINDCDKYIGRKLIDEPPFANLETYNYFEITIPAIDLTEKFGLAYILTGDKKYGEESKRRLLDICSWDPNGSTSDEHNDEPAMWIIMRGLRAYDMTYDLYTPEEREKVEEVMKIRAQQFYDRLKYRPNREYHSYNFGSHEGRILSFLGQAALCFAHEWEEAEDWLEYVLTLYWNLWPAWGKEDGGWHQGPSYWGLYIGFAVQFVAQLEKAAGIDLMEKPFLQNTPYYKLYTNPPYANMSPFGDGEHHPPFPGKFSTYDKSGQVMYQFSTLLRDPYLRWYSDFLNAGPGEYTVGAALKDDRIIGKPPLDLPQSRYFPGIGLVSLHSKFGDADEDIHFLFHSDPYGKFGHHHPDENAFTLEAFGEALAIASGYYDFYGTKHHRNWQLETKSSNCITIDGGIGQKKEASSKGKIVTFEVKDDYDYILGDATQTYGGLLKKFLRHIIHIRPGIFVIFDDLEAPKPVTFEWWLHALSEMNVDPEKKTIRISQGNAGLKVHFLQSEKIDFNQFEGFPDPPKVSYNPMNVAYGEKPKDQWHVTASTASKRMKSKYITVLIPFKKGEEPEILAENLIETPNEVSMKLSVMGKRYFVSFKPEVTVRQVNF